MDFGTNLIFHGLKPMLSEHSGKGEGICLSFYSYYENEVEKCESKGLVVGILVCSRS